MTIIIITIVNQLIRVTPTLNLLTITENQIKFHAQVTLKPLLNGQVCNPS